MSTFIILVTSHNPPSISTNVNYTGISFFIITSFYFLKDNQLFACDFSVRCLCNMVLYKTREIAAMFTVFVKVEV